MNKAEIIARVAKNTGYTMVDTKEIVDNLFTTIIDANQEGEKVTITGFGLFKPRTYVPRITYHPVTKEAMKIPTRPVPVFYPSKIYKKALRG